MESACTSRWAIYGSRRRVQRVEEKNMYLNHRCVHHLMLGKLVKGKNPKYVRGYYMKEDYNLNIL